MPVTSKATPTTYLTIFAKAFAGERVNHQRCLVEKDGTVRVYDHCAGYYTTCHELSEAHQNIVRERAKQQNRYFLPTRE
jgi:hypothetical protein